MMLLQIINWIMLVIGDITKDIDLKIQYNIIKNSV